MQKVGWLKIGCLFMILSLMMSATMVVYADINTATINNDNQIVTIEGTIQLSGAIKEVTLEVFSSDIDLGKLSPNQPENLLLVYRKQTTADALGKNRRIFGAGKRNGDR